MEIMPRRVAPLSAFERCFRVLGFFSISINEKKRKREKERERETDRQTEGGRP